MDRRTLLAASAALAICPGLSARAASPSSPSAIIAEVYRRLIVEQNRAPGDLSPAYDSPDSLFAPALRQAFADERREAKGELGRLDFYFWVNGQDWSLSDLRIEERTVWRRPDRRVVTASFLNSGQPSLLEFYFQNHGGRWLIEEVASIPVPHDGEPGYGWTLSLILRFGREEDDPA